MRVFLLRHAEAVDHAPTDAARGLTEHGLEQARTAGVFCHRHHLQPELILTSPYRRAVQTAEQVAGATETLMQVAPFLASGMEPKTALGELGVYQRLKSVMLVGHQPDLGMLIAALLGWKDGENVEVGKAALTGVRLSRIAAGGGSLEFFLPVTLMF